MTKYLLLLFIFFSATSAVQAQDKIHRKNGKIILAKVIEIGTSDIKYKIFEEADGPVYVLEKDHITKIVFESGKTESFKPDLKDPEAYVGQRNKAIKIDFLGPLIGYSQITFEKSIGVGKSYEVSLGIIGAGKNQRFDYIMNDVRLEKRNQFGFSGSFGYKFNKLPDFIFGRTRFHHLMQGGYAKPILYVGNYSENRLNYKNGITNYEYVIDRTNTTFAALQMELGKQWVFADQFLLDTYWGFGYGFDNKKGDYVYAGDEGDAAAFNYINARAGRSPGFSLTYGIKVGMLLK